MYPQAIYPRQVLAHPLQGRAATTIASEIQPSLRSRADCPCPFDAFSGERQKTGILQCCSPETRRLNTSELNSLTYLLILDVRRVPAHVVHEVRLCRMSVAVRTSALR